jgi:hypothetical protein
MGIDRVQVRARIQIGILSVSTPFIQSFNVRKQRGQISTFDASLKVSHEQVSSRITGDNVKIYAGTKGGMPLIYSGLVRNAKISPCFDDPKYVILTISGADVLSLLAGKKYSRRSRATKSCWVAITGVSRPGLKSGKFTSQNADIIEFDPGKLNSEKAVVAHVPSTAQQGEPGVPSTKGPDGVTFQIGIGAGTDATEGGGA